MPPKQQASKKTDMKKKEKLIEDKTFGIKNKKGAKQQKFVQQINNQVKQTSVSKQQAELAKKKADKNKDELDDINKLLKPVLPTQPAIGKDVDPKSVLCLFFKQGLCTKGNKCKWSHDLLIEQKKEKRNIYVDPRDLKDQEKLREQLGAAVYDRLTEDEVEDRVRQLNNRSKTICPHFLTAVENTQYGWFWECPGGGDKCVYRHALPPGFVLKKDKKNLDDLDKQDVISLEDLIETERSKLSSKTLTKVTLESFIAWKKKKLREKKQKEAEEEKKKMEKAKMGKQGGMSGRDLFYFNPDLVQQDDDDADDVRYQKELEEGEEEYTGTVFEIDENTFFKIEGLDEDDLDEPSSSANNAAEGVGKMSINADLFDVDDVDGLESGDEES